MNGRASGPVLTSEFLAVLNHCGRLFILFLLLFSPLYCLLCCCTNALVSYHSSFLIFISSPWFPSFFYRRINSLVFSLLVFLPPLFNYLVYIYIYIFHSALFWFLLSLTILSLFILFFSTSPTSPFFTFSLIVHQHPVGFPSPKRRFSEV